MEMADICHRVNSAVGRWATPISAAWLAARVLEGAAARYWKWHGGATWVLDDGRPSGGAGGKWHGDVHNLALAAGVRCQSGRLGGRTDRQGGPAHMRSSGGSFCVAAPPRGASGESLEHSSS